MRITKRFLSLGLAIAILLSLATFPSQALQATAVDYGVFQIFDVSPAVVAPGDTVTFTFSVIPSVSVPTGYVQIVAVPGGLANPSPNPAYFTNVPTGTPCSGSIGYTVTATSGTITVYGVFYIVTDTDTYFINSTNKTITVGKTLSVGKVTTATTVVSGATFGYTVTVTNLSGTTATQVRVTDSLPSELEYISGTASVVSTSPLTFALPDINNNSSHSFSLFVRAKTTTSTKIAVNSVTVSASGYVASNPVLANPVIIIPATTGFTKEVNKTQAAPGDTLTYTIKFVNPTGSPTIYNAKIIDYIPANTGYLSASTSQGNVYPPTTGQNYVTWNLGTIAPGVVVTAILNVQIFNTVSWNTIINNIAYFYEGATITYTANAPGVTILPAPFSIEKTASPTVVQPGQQVSFSISFKNISTSTATGVSVVDYVDPRFTIAGVGGSYQISGNQIIWPIGDLAPGTPTVTVSFWATANSSIAPGVSIPNKASVKGSGTAEVSTTIYILVGLPSALTFQKSVDSQNILPGADALFTISVKNPTTNPTIPTLTITDTLPSQLAFKSASSGYSRTDSVVTWTLSNLSPGATGTVTLAATVIPTLTVGSTITNTSMLEVGGLTPVFASSSFQVGQAEASPLKISKIATADSVQKGEYITYIITYANSGNTILNGAKIEESIPANTTFLNGNPTPIVDTANNKVIWDLGELAPGANGTILAQFGVPATVPDGTQIGNTVLGKVSGYQDAATPTVFVTVGPVLHNAYITGYPDGNFQPEKPITRAEIATILSRILNLGQSTAPSQTFSDLQSNHWAYGYINSIINAGIMNGYPDGTFGPDRSITRAELSTVMVRVRGLFPIMVAPPTFPDIAGHWAAGYIESAQRAMFITGYPSGDFRPDRSITRAETVTLINRAFGFGPLVGNNVVQSFPDVPKNHWAFAWVAEAAKSHYGVHSSEGTESLINYL